MFVEKNTVLKQRLIRQQKNPTAPNKLEATIDNTREPKQTTAEGTT